MSGLDTTPGDHGTAADVRRRYLILRATRWLPTGLIVPVFVLVMLDRGLSLGQIGLVVAGQGIAVMALELPTGGLADAIGRRRVLVAASAVELAAGLLFLVADSMLLLLAFWVLEGIYRALESGPLDAWFVDRSQAVDPDADLERGLSTAGVVLGLAIAVGA
uniref:MFS transporter n=1 Tax=Euzebya pacifica TaxID=1608957 RepID=UPI0030FBFE06